jgi:hypothetical protein
MHLKYNRERITTHPSEEREREREKPTKTNPTIKQNMLKT